MAYYFSYSAKSLSAKLKQIATPDLYSKLYNKNKLHCTMLYNQGLYKEEYKTLVLPDIEVTINSIEVWKTESGSVVVAKLSGQEVYSMAEKITQTFNIQPDKDFNPHITLRKIVSDDQFLTQEEMSQLEYLKGHTVELSKFTVVPIMPKLKLKI